MASKHNPRIVLTISLLGNAITCCLFGTATSIEQAIAIRLMQGIFAGAIGVARGTVASITDQTNEGRAYAILGYTFFFIIPLHRSYPTAVAIVSVGVSEVSAARFWAEHVSNSVYGYPHRAHVDVIYSGISCAEVARRFWQGASLCDVSVPVALLRCGVRYVHR